MSAVEAYKLYEEEKAKPRNQDPRRLTHYGRKVFSQNDEDGIIEEIYRRIGINSHSFVEFGTESGIECNTLWLLFQGWSGLWIDGNPEACNQIRETHSHWLEAGALHLENRFIDAENINEIINARYSDCEIDLLSIDIDYNDYWVWNAVETINPRVVVIEYNASWAPPASITVPYEPGRRWDGTNYFGASLGALTELGKRKGYELVGCCLAGVNAFFVRSDLAKGRFLTPGSVIEHYEPPRYFLAGMRPGHRPSVGPVVQVPKA